ncbi:MAG: M28 family peptidase [Planctomycetes bacterium]|nr:M28 family peptidase [Planctomycetota bacterium]
MPKRLAAFAPLLAALFFLRPASSEPEDPRRRPDLIAAVKRVDEKTLREHLFWLADPARTGRDTDSPGSDAAAQYIVAWYEKCGMVPKGSDGFFQPWGNAGKKGVLKDSCCLLLGKAAKKVTVEFDSGFKPAKCCTTGSAAADVVFAGFGITAKEYGYDDYAGIKVDGKVVLVFDHEPQETNEASPFDGAKPTKYSDIATKAAAAKEHGAAALLVMRDATNHPDEKGFPSDDELGWPGDEKLSAGLPVVYISDESAAQLAVATGRKEFAGFQKKIDESGKPSSAPLSCPCEVRVTDHAPILGGQKNIIAMKEGEDPELKNEFVILSAHYDHIGLGTAQDSLGGTGKIHPGADDNASGTSGLMELAYALQPLHTKRSLLLINFDGEEAGLLGSKAFADKPTVPMGKIVAILNMDMISRNKPAAINVGGIGRNKRLDEVLHTISARYGLTMDTDGMDQYIQRSDQWSLMEKGVPGVFFFGGMHPDYHTDKDTPDKCNITKMKLITLVCLVFLDEVANGENPRK